MRLVLFLGEREYDLGSQRALMRMRAALPEARFIVVKKAMRWYRWDHSWLASSVERILNLDPCDPGCPRSALAELGTASVDGVVAIHEDCLRAAAAVAAALGLSSPDPEVVETCRDKLRLRHALARAGIGVPESIPCRTPEEARDAALRVGLPVVVKPRDKAGSTGVMIVERIDDLTSAFTVSNGCRWSESRYGDVLVEPHFPGQVVTVNGFVWGGTFSLLATSTKRTTGHPYLLTREDEMPAAVPHAVASACVEATHLGCKAIGLERGVVHCEVVVTENGPCVLEITPRPGGGYVAPMVLAHCGADLFAIAAWLAVGIAPVPATGPTRHVAGRIVRSPRTGILTDLFSPSAGQEIEALWTKRRGDAIQSPPRDFFAELGYAIASGGTRDEAAARLARYLEAVRATVEECGMLSRTAILLRRAARDENLPRRLASYLAGRALDFLQS